MVPEDFKAQDYIPSGSGGNAQYFCQESNASIVLRIHINPVYFTQAQPIEKDSAIPECPEAMEESKVR
ncbi:hypothetical protein WISP_11090 [Willisornis vidua]|uniref:Uncharacterized protein n=1 Tax=Willisornis vidua TaxID=1566151 RepID=A0ABQ9DR92_9PASS|nr:hypothetical protein WISP_11090 [Willisornis vidua]